jgi:hypothetical protein
VAYGLFKRVKYGPAMSDKSSRLRSIADAASYCGVSVGLFRAQIMTNLKPLRMGGRRLIDLRALDAWLDTQSEVGTKEKTRWADRLDEDNDQGAAKGSV